MIVFKSYRSLFIVASLLFSLVACVKADRTSQETHQYEQTALGHGQIVPTEFLGRSLTEVNNGARFLSGALEMKVNTTFDGKSYWKQANQMELKFKTCGLRDIQSNGILNGQKFQIKSELGNPIEAISMVTDSGCLEWAYIVPVNLVAPSVNLAIHFEIKSINNLGRIVKRLGFNPWDIIRNKAFRDRYGDLTNHSREAWGSGQWIYGTDKVLAALRGELLDNNAKLVVKNLSVEPVEKSSGAGQRYDEMLASLSPEERKRRKKIDQQMRAQQGIFVNLNLSAQPIVNLTDSTGVPYAMPIETGRFRVFMNLLAHNTATGKKHIINQYVPAMSEGGGAAFTWMADNVNGIQASIPMILKARSTYGEMELVVKIVPIDLKNVEPFTAVYNLGQYNAWARRQAPSFQRESYKPLTEVDFVKYIKKADNYKEYKERFERGLGAGKDKSLANQQLFYFDEFNIRFMRIMPGETATDRTFQYAVRTCISHGVFGYRVDEGLQFEVTTRDKGKDFTIVRQTRNNGCLTWFGFVSHKYYHKEVLEEKTARVRFIGTAPAASGDKGKKERDQQWEKLVNKFEKTFTYYMNPWDEKFTFGWDGESLPENYSKTIEKQREDAPESKLFIHDFRYETMGFRYEIDKYMNLKVKKTVLLKMYPTVLKYNSIVYGRRGTEPLRDGIYLMKLALQKDYLDPAARGIVIKDRKASDRISQPVMTKGGKTVNNQLFDSDEVLRQDKKQSITIQQKLIRVLGGIIITPIELEVEDLRLMRIRNQFFIQIQTIDENKLRLATFLDKEIKDLQDTVEADKNYVEIFKKMDQIEDLDQKIVDEHQQNQVNKEAIEGLSQKTDLETAKKALLGLLKLDPKSSNYKQQLEAAKAKFQEVDQYRKLGVTGQTAARNDKWRIINRLVQAFGNKTEELVEEYGQYATENDENNQDPFQKYFTMTQDSEKVAITKLLGSGSKAQQLKEFLRNTDFTEGTLAPNFPFEVLTNDGLKPEESGLPKRTFVGPLTFLLNSNGSPLRPTDILEEAVCLTASCGVPEKIADGVPPVPTLKLFNLDKEGRAQDLPGPVYALGDSVNAAYENNEYYGYLKKYHGWTVDKLIEQREQLLKKKEKLQKTSSQIINFISALGLKYTNLGSDTRSDLKDIDISCVKAADSSSVEQCFKETKNSRSRNISRQDLLAMLNGKKARYAYWRTEKDRNWFMFGFESLSNIFDALGQARYDGKKVQPEDLKELMAYGWKDSRLDQKKVERLSHRFCYVLGQNLLSDNYLKEENKYLFGSDKNNWTLLYELEKKCHAQVDNLYKEKSGEFSHDYVPPVIFERKVRVYDTTKKYVYRGGKSLNINVSSSFSLSHNESFSRNRSASFKPTDLVKDGVGLVPYVGKVLKSIVGSVGLSVSYGDNSGVSRSDGTSVSAGTFLVSQQATIDIEIGEYERCMVARFSPSFLTSFLKEHEDILKKRFVREDDFETLGLMICSGERKKESLPVKEKYYYFTQHFTEGDMLDTHDLHNHPWLLQLRGYRDFRAFVGMIGAREQKYADAGMWDKYYNKIKSDAASLLQDETDNRAVEFEVLNKAKEPDWPLTALGEAYFNVLPTFPGLYTYVEDDEHQVRDWPYGNPDPREAFKKSPSEE